MKRSLADAAIWERIDASRDLLAAGRNRFCGERLCYACAFWLPLGDASQAAGDCNRYPRTVFKRAFDWCGEFQPVPDPTTGGDAA